MGGLVEEGCAGREAAGPPRGLALGTSECERRPSGRERRPGENRADPAASSSLTGERLLLNVLLVSAA